MRVLVTGSDGYIGRGVVEKLLAAGHQVVAMGYRSCDLESELLTEILGDVFEADLDFINENTPDVLLHLAWMNGFNHRDSVHITDLPRHYDFLSRAIDAGVGRIAVMGSMHEVGYHEGAVEEGTRCDPTTPYGVAKNALRQLMLGRCAESGTVLQWLRGFYLISNDGRGNSIFSKIVAAARQGKTSFPLSSGKNEYDFLPYDDFCDQVVAVILQDAVDGIINICSGKPVSLGEQIEAFVKDNAIEIELEYGKYPDRPYDSPAIWGDASKIEKVLSRSVS